ncbi:hypothetical protein OSC27_02360 [Microbacterium sp. STN6]|uniref:hypothetical protein n=1 Tax=Microbacterium sp. STN6 TaxID=2995588 RepID=UPI002260BB38|nr:hypothetical protein [Microbacterium sp. STN6]MCX7521117.1 hypothetical protein [Microbacterium sp. STN6]
MARVPADGTVAPHRVPTAGVRMLRSRLVLWIAFLVVHLVAGWLALAAPGAILGDVTTVYRPWALDAVHGYVVGIDTPWVYPIAAIVPVMLPLVLGPAHYVGAWLTLVLIADAAGFAVLIAGRRPGRVWAAWWWLLFMLLLGPVGVSRLDSLSVPMAIVGLLWLAGRPAVAAVLLTVATWIKVWPAALIAAIVVASRRRWRFVALGLVTSGVIALVAVVFGAGANVLSFVTAQADRGMQLEAPASGIWLWQALLGRPGSMVYYQASLNTFEVTGDGVEAGIRLMTPLLAFAAAALVLLGVRAVRARVPLATLLPDLALALVAALIVFNKVGSPQYMLWLVPPVVLGLAWRGRGYLVPAVLVAVAAGLTQVFYPVLYNALLGLDPVLVVVLSVRNLVVVAVFVWAVSALWRSVGYVRRARLE